MNRAADWLGQAEADLKGAEDSAATGRHEWAAFPAQQSGEKAVRGLVQSLHGEARGHSLLGVLRQLASRLAVPEPVLKAARILEKVYIAPRYPNAFVSGKPADHFSGETSEELIGYARSVLEFCRIQIH